MTKLLVELPVDDRASQELLQRSDLDIERVEPVYEVRSLPRDRIEDVDVLCCVYPPANLEDMRRLKWIQLATAGYEQLYSLSLAERGIRASNARGVFDVPIAEWNIAMMVNLKRNLRQMIRHQDARRWEIADEFQKGIHGETVGLWGYGGIGRETARLARAMGMRVHVLSRRRGPVARQQDVYTAPGTGDPKGELPHRYFQSGEEREFLAGLDFLVLAMPLTRSTEGIVTAEHLRALPRHAFVLNPARGRLIQEAALIESLEKSWIAGAAIDTHYAYPLPAEHPLWAFPNVILTPHVSGSPANQQFGERMWGILTENVRRFLAGETLLNELTAEQLGGA